MQFVSGGPDVPEMLLQAHEEGRVVFFCGAGISYPAGLPGFHDLVESIYNTCGTQRSPNEQQAFDRGQFDATLDLLERRLPGRRLAVRKAVWSALQPNLRLKGAIDTHRALLALATSRDGSLRLVTTNFDRIFETVAKRARLELHVCTAPMLPVPKNSRWNALVHLHGVLPAGDDEAALQRLVLTSGDFGLAYLTERWAARFVGELFRNYAVCFIGYSINDPVLRYMMDALAADRMLGETTPMAWAFADCKAGQDKQTLLNWEAKGVTPILYDAAGGVGKHPALHKTLHAWAATYRDGVSGKEAIVINHALSRPTSSTREDDFVGRVLWALTDNSGLPARRFAEFNPAPSLDWLFEVFADARLAHSDLRRFDIAPQLKPDPKFRFSLVNRPASYPLATPMSLVPWPGAQTQWDTVMRQIAGWLLRHLNDPSLVLWIAQRGAEMHESLAWLIEHRLAELAKLRQEGKNDELSAIREHSPNGIPDEPMQTLWRLLLRGRVRSARQDLLLYGWFDRLKREGLSTTLRLELRSLLAPMVTFAKPLRWGNERDRESENRQLRDIVACTIQLQADFARPALSDSHNLVWKSAQPNLLREYQILLRDALDLMRECDDANDHSDRSFWDLPSVSAHWQNNGFRDWTALIELLRDAWLQVLESEPRRALLIAREWFEIPYPTFKRLALFASQHDSVADADEWVGWLLDDDGRWLWSFDLHRETLRLIVLQGNRLAPSSKRRLEKAICRGPSRHDYPDDTTPEEWSDFVDRAVWLHLAKLRSSGAQLQKVSMQRLRSLEELHPTWEVSANERDEFLHWWSGTGAPDYEDERIVDKAPRRRRELVAWLRRQSVPRAAFYEDTWRDVCRTRFFHSWLALCDLSHADEWPTDRWNGALSSWSETSIAPRAWHFAAPLVASMPDDVLAECARNVASWIDAASRSMRRHKTHLLSLCQRLLDLPLASETGITQNGQPIDSPVTEAINHPVGHVAQALVNLWFSGDPSDHDGLPAHLAPVFTALCDLGVDRFRHARVIFCSRLIALYRVDPSWTTLQLLPLFSWSNVAQARAAWEGFLWSARLFPPLLVALKADLLMTAEHYNALGEHGGQYAAFLTYAALAQIEGYSLTDFRGAMSVLPAAGLLESAQAISQALESAGDQRAEYWHNRVQPFWRQAWPQSKELVTPRIAEALVRVCISADNAFPQALDTLRDWLREPERSGLPVHLLSDSTLCTRFPSESLDLLDIIVVDPTWPPSRLGDCLTAIALAAAPLSTDVRFIRLREYARRHGV